jgi:hypothetical protein
MGAYQLRHQPRAHHRLDEHQTALEEVMKNQRPINLEHVIIAIIMGVLGVALAFAIIIAG